MSANAFEEQSEIQAAYVQGAHYAYTNPNPGISIPRTPTSNGSPHMDAVAAAYLDGFTNGAKFYGEGFDAGKLSKNKAVRIPRTPEGLPGSAYLAGWSAALYSDGVTEGGKRKRSSTRRSTKKSKSRKNRK